MHDELTKTIKNIEKLQKSHRDTAAHFLLGYLWASLSKSKRNQIAKTFADQLKEQEWNK